KELIGLKPDLILSQTTPSPRSPLAFGLGMRQTKRVWFRHTVLSRLGKKRGDLALDAARAAHPSLVLHRELATPQSASAACRAVVSALLGSRARHASDRRRPRHAASRRFHRVQARPAPQPVRRLPQQARRQQCPARAGPRGWYAFRPEPSVE